MPFWFFLLFLLFPSSHALVVESAVQDLKREAVVAEKPLVDSHKGLSEDEIVPTKSEKWSTLEKPRQNVRPVPIVLIPRKHKHAARRRCNSLTRCGSEQRSRMQTKPTAPVTSKNEYEAISKVSDEDYTRQVVYFRGMQAQHRMMSEL